MKKVKFKFVLLLLVGFFTTFLSGCEFTFLQNKQPITLSGYVTIENMPIENVKIVSDFYTYATTDSNGYYTFETRNKNLVFYAKKSGYSFNPKTYDASNPETSYDFVATEATKLNGTITLTEILIAPTSIVSIPGNNFEYVSESKASLKFHSFALKLNNTQSFVFQNDSELLYLEKNTFTNILLQQQNFSQTINEGKANLSFEFQLKTFYKISNFSEEISFEKPSIYKTNTTLDTGDLDENNNLKFSIQSINSQSNGFTYNLQFVFKYQEN